MLPPSMQHHVSAQLLQTIQHPYNMQIPVEPEYTTYLSPQLIRDLLQSARVPRTNLEESSNSHNFGQRQRRANFPQQHYPHDTDESDSSSSNSRTGGGINSLLYLLKHSKKPSKKPSKKVIKKPLKKPSKKVIKKPSKKVIKKPSKKPLKKTK
jgi:hypothetical protein